MLPPDWPCSEAVGSLLLSSYSRALHRATKLRPAFAEPYEAVERVAGRTKPHHKGGYTWTRLGLLLRSHTLTVERK
jgi:hypothetical protein